MHTLMDDAPAQSALSPVPSHAEDGRELYLQGLLALRDGHAEQAAGLLTQALRRQPSHHGMRRNLVRALLVAEHFERVVVQANAALTGTPDDAELHFARGTALNALGHHAQSCAAFARALALQPDHAPSWLNMGNASADLNDLASAETLYRTAIRLDESLPEAHASLGYVLTMQGRLNEAIEACEAAIRVRPDFPQAHWNLAIAALLGGDLRRGFAEYEWRKRHPLYRADFPNLPGRQWDGGDAAGQTILVRAEQGFGDVIQFVRYLPLIRDMGAHPVLVCAPSLVPLFNAISGITVCSPADPLPAYDAWIDQISLPLLFGTTLDTVPASTAYLRADADRTEAWRSRLDAGLCKRAPNCVSRTGDWPQDGQIPEVRVGIVVAGNPRHNRDERRSIPPELDWKLPKRAGLSFVNLRHGASACPLGLPDLTPWLTDFAETAALIENLDLVITVDTAVAHLAGALGKPVWILLPHAPDWRWLLGRADSPWYRSARLFRQPAPGDWNGVLVQVTEALALGW